MTRKFLLGVLGVSLAACGSTDATGPGINALFGGPPPPPPAPTTYSGRATAVQAKVLFLNATVGDTGPLPASGGAFSSGLASVTVPGVVSAGTAQAATSGGNDAAASSASIADVAATVLGLGVSASIIASETQASCAGGVATVGGSSTLADLRINGSSVTVTGAPNQVIQVGGVKVYINEQTGDANSITVTAIRVSVAGLADVVLSRTHSDIHCGVGG